MARILSSWKEIAQYLGKGVRTVQRWEQTAGLPVKRPAKGQQHIVLACTDDIDAWLAHGGEDAETSRLREQNAKLLARIEELEQQLAKRPIQDSPLFSARGNSMRERYDTLRLRTSELHRALSETLRIAGQLRSQHETLTAAANTPTIFRVTKH